MRKLASVVGMGIVLIAVVAVAVSLIPALIVFNFSAPYIAAALRWLTVMATDWGGELGTLYSALLLGFAAFALRTWGRPWYAYIEIFFGAYGGGIALGLLYRPDLLRPEFQALAPAHNPYPTYVGLGSAIYVMVRGLDNGLSWVKKKSEERPTAKQPIG